MKKAVIYARYSCSKQREASIEQQVEACRQYCEREGLAVVEEYADYAFSGRTDERPQFQRMIANAGESDFVVVYALDRFSRDQYDAPIYKKELSRFGVKVVSATEHIEDTPDGLIMSALLEAIAARESLVIGQRAKRGMEANAKDCKTNGYRVFGYREDADRKYTIAEEEAAFVVEAYARRLSAEPVDAIARDFARRGVKTRFGKPCSASMVDSMLKNERYTGVYIWGDVRVDGGMPQIIDVETWEQVQGVKGPKRRKEEEWGVYMLSGKAICGKCGMNMFGSSGRGSSGKRYDYYRCKCGHSVRKETLEDAVVVEIRNFVAGDAAYVMAQQVKDYWEMIDNGADLANARKRLSDARTGKKNLIAAMECGVMDKDVTERLTELQGEIEDATREIAVLEKTNEFDTEEFVEFLRFGATLDDVLLISIFVFTVVVLEDKALVTLTYNENNGGVSEAKQLSAAFAFVQDGWPSDLQHEHAIVYGGLVMLVTTL